jgi:TIR domain
MTLPINKRDFDVFLSHAHQDRVFVSELDNWLTEKAGFRVWYDARELASGALLARGRSEPLRAGGRGTQTEWTPLGCPVASDPPTIWLRIYGKRENNEC